MGGSRYLSETLTPELMAEASRRLGWLGLIYAGGSIVARFGRSALLVLGGSPEGRFRAPDVFDVMAAALGLGVYLVSRRGLLSQRGLT